MQEKARKKLSFHCDEVRLQRLNKRKVKNHFFTAWLFDMSRVGEPEWSRVALFLL